MTFFNVKSLVERLDDRCRSSLEAAAGLCLSRTNFNVEVEHWLVKLVEDEHGDVVALCRYYEIDKSRLLRDLTRVLDRLKTGNARPPALSPSVVTLIQQAWLVASVQFQASRVRSGHLLCALLTEDSLSRLARDASAEFAKIPLDSLTKDLRDITADSDENDRSPGAESEAAESTRSSNALDQFTIDLTAQARAGKIDPVLGRDVEIGQIIDILSRRRQNNPILTGEAGVGKTAVVEGFALRIVKGDVPPSLRDVSLRMLDLGLLQAGAGIKGEFEGRLKSVIKEVHASTKPIILFIDEAHTLIGAGGQAGQNDAANLLKPALARGELRTIAATTWAEYARYFEGDAALTRRFQVVKVDEPSEGDAVAMMRALVPTLEKHHGVRILDESVVEAVRLSRRYITARQLPDKSVALLDTVCARVSLSQNATPALVEAARRRVQQLETTMALLKRESSTGIDHTSRLSALADEREAANAELSLLEKQWQDEMVLLGEAKQLATALEAQAKSSAPEEKQRAQFRGVLDKLRKAQGKQPLVHFRVEPSAVADVVSGWTGIPVGRMVSDDASKLLELQSQLEERIVGQSHALKVVAERIRTARANLQDARRPVGVFLMVGTSGVGKTETGLALSELLFGGTSNTTIINMSEYKEEHRVSLLWGAPPGYVGFGEGAVLTEPIRRKPYSVVILDEFEKAHPGLQDVFYDLFDRGTMRDSKGRDVDFRNTIIIMTSNAGTAMIEKLCADAETVPDPSALVEALRPELAKIFRPAFLGRVTVVPYYPLTPASMTKIIELQLRRIGRRIQDNYGATFSFDRDVVDRIAKHCRNVGTGARSIDHMLSHTLLPELSTLFLGRLGDHLPISKVHVSADESAVFRYQIS